MTDRELWTTSRCCEHCNIKPGTWRSYRTRPDGPPAPVGRQPGKRGEDLYDAEEVRAWHAGRPGRGARTDLRKVDKDGPDAGAE